MCAYRVRAVAVVVGVVAIAIVVVVVFHLCCARLFSFFDLRCLALAPRAPTLLTAM